MDPNWIQIQLGLRIRIRIGNSGGVRIQAGKNDPDLKKIFDVLDVLF
jgi:hypothetical protein